MANKSQNIVTVSGNALNMQIQQGVSRSVQEMNSGECIDYAEARRIIDKIMSYRSLFQQEFGNQSPYLEQSLQEASLAAERKEPGRLEKAWESIKNIMENAAGSIIATGILTAMTQVSGLI